MRNKNYEIKKKDIALFPLWCCSKILEITDWVSLHNAASFINFH